MILNSQQGKAMQPEDLVPVYPSDIQGDLRLILQTKDLFILSYKFLEEYNELMQEQHSIITKALIDERLHTLEAELSILRDEEMSTRKKLEFHMFRNEHLMTHLDALGLNSIHGGSAHKMAYLHTTTLRHQAILSKYAHDEKTPPENPLNEFLALQDELLVKVKPMLFFYRDLYYLQLHFVIILTQICQACLPLLIQHIPLVERLFFWNERRPEFLLLRSSTDVSDRLREIYTRTQQVLGVLFDCISFLREQLHRKRQLLHMFNIYLDWQEKVKNDSLQRLHQMQNDIDHLEEENDRMIGTIVKVDPAFVESEEFREIADLSLMHMLLTRGLIHEQMQESTGAPCFCDEHGTPNLKTRFEVTRKPPRHKLLVPPQGGRNNFQPKPSLKDQLISRTGNILETMLSQPGEYAWQGEITTNIPRQATNGNQFMSEFVTNMGGASENNEEYLGEVRVNLPPPETSQNSNFTANNSLQAAAEVSRSSSLEQRFMDYLRRINNFKSASPSSAMSDSHSQPYRSRQRHKLEKSSPPSTSLSKVTPSQSQFTASRTASNKSSFEPLHFPKDASWSPLGRSEVELGLDRILSHRLLTTPMSHHPSSNCDQTALSNDVSPSEGQ